MLMFSDNFTDPKFANRNKTIDLAKLATQARRRHRFGLGIFALVIIILGWAYFQFQNTNSTHFSEESVRVILNGPTQAPAGQEVEYIINYENNQRVDLVEVVVDLRLPLGFKVVSSTPALTDNTRLNIGQIGGFKTGQITIKAQITGLTRDKKILGALFSYKPETTKAEFAKTLSLTTELVSSVLNLEVPESLEQAVEQNFILPITYRNSSGNKLSNLLLKFDLPGGFEMELPALNPAPNLNNVWQLPNLEAEAQGKVELKGKFTTTSGLSSDIKIAVGFFDAEGKNFVLQEEKNVAVKLIKAALNLDLTVNEENTKSAVELGQEINFQLSYSNGGEVPIKNLTLKAQLDAKWFDLSSFKDDSSGHLNTETGAVEWTAKEVPNLENLPAGARGLVGFRMRLKGNLPTGVVKPASFTSRAEISGEEVLNGIKQNITTSANEVVSKISTNLILETEARYFTDELIKVGSGPLPPKVFETTTYVVYFRLSNTLNEADNLEVTTTLPADVIWTNQANTSVGNKPTYNPNTREVKWILNRLPAGAGTVFAKPEASFEVAITPKESDADKIFVLTRTTALSARDTFSNAAILKTARFLTTELLDDLGATGKGAVSR